VGPRRSREASSAAPAAEAAALLLIADVIRPRPACGRSALPRSSLAITPRSSTRPQSARMISTSVSSGWSQPCTATVATTDQEAHGQSPARSPASLGRVVDAPEAEPTSGCSFRRAGSPAPSDPAAPVARTLWFDVGTTDGRRCHGRSVALQADHLSMGSNLRTRGVAMRRRCHR
jgi:hypothetical protein